MIVVVNTSPLIALDRIEHLDILPRLFGKVIRPQSVVEELHAGKKAYGGSSELFESSWMDTREDPPEMVFRQELGAGETAAITLAKKLEADLILLDDLAARNVAQGLGLPVSGTLGVIIAASKKGILPDLTLVVNELMSCGFRLSKEIRDNILRF